MLQQTPVTRVLPIYESWLQRWPDAAALAAASPGDAVRVWGKLGYPRRALRLHECAVEVVASYDGELPADIALLEALPGIGSYTARAVAVFAFGQRHPVVDTNVRRVVARAVLGRAEAGPPSPKRDHQTLDGLLPPNAAEAARMSIALMELGALVCTARTPNCTRCPIEHQCAWSRAGRPAHTGPTAKPQRFAGTDRQVRGKLLDVLRATDQPVTKAQLDLVWNDPQQRDRALNALLTDGLVTRTAKGDYSLPT